MTLEGTDGSIWSPNRLRAASNSAGVALWSWNVDTDTVSMDERGYALWGLPKNDALTFEVLSSCIEPTDVGAVREIIRATRRSPGPYEIDFRILRGDQICWIAARGLGADEGIIGRIMFGIFLDVTDAKKADEVRELLAGEMSHRVKNLFATASALTAIAGRSTTSTAEMAVDLQQRLNTLWRAHDLIRPGVGQDGGRYANSNLADLFSIFLGPYDNRGSIGDRIRVSLPDVAVGETSAKAFALIVHELSTNSVKYGSLSTASGSLDISCRADKEKLTIIWTERGGPRVSTPVGPGGFGSKLISRTLSGQLGGSIVYKWPSQGAIITIHVGKESLAN